MNAEGETRLDRLGTGHLMDELIGRLASKAGIGSTVAKKTHRHRFRFTPQRGTTAKVQALIDQFGC